MKVALDEDIGQMAGAIWHALNTHGELSLVRLKNLVEGKGVIFDWAIGWLARDGKVVIIAKKRSFSIGQYRLEITHLPFKPHAKSVLTKQTLQETRY
jgi:hypothetical protein